MAKIGRNDPCHCGSGKKYKQCHLPIEEAARTEQLRRRRAVDALMPRLLQAAGDRPGDVVQALERYWQGKYDATQLDTLDDLEDRGADRFLAWLAFDFRSDDGMTLVERLAADPTPLDATPLEAELLAAWVAVRLRPYRVEAIRKGDSFTVLDLLDGHELVVEDHAASRRLAAGDVLVTHLVAAGERTSIAGAAAHLTSDTAEKIAAYAELHREALRRDQPAATWADLLAARSEVFNHFVMALPVETADPTILD
ncbi:MAG TPA: SEC-C domain-containing protein, partial [Roseiflexaceae bacterium]|nr:SEC-C domain-containing protein [Roseiflexaceae bacterium]